MNYCRCNPFEATPRCEHCFGDPCVCSCKFCKKDECDCCQLCGHGKMAHSLSFVTKLDRPVCQCPCHGHAARRNPDEELRKVERDYLQTGDPLLRTKLNRLRKRASLEEIPVPQDNVGKRLRIWYQNGPCLEQGSVARETEAYYFLDNGRKYKKNKLNHTTPCINCGDYGGANKIWIGGFDNRRNPKRRRKSIQPTIRCIKCRAYADHLLKDLCQECYRAKYTKVSPDSCNRCGGFGEYPECPLCGDIAS